MHILVSGLVQGVCFRACTRDEAGALGLVGFVRNLSDGRVEIVAEGAEEKLLALAAWSRRGPPGARVEETVVAREIATGEYSSFRIAPDR